MASDRIIHIIANIVWLGFAIAVTLESLHIEVGTFKAPGPGFLTFFAGVTLGTLSLISLVQCCRKSQVKVITWVGGLPLRAGIGLAALFCYVALLDTLGFLLDGFLLLLILFNVVTRVRWRIALIASILTVTGSYLFFVILLGNTFPKGLLGF